MNSRFNLPFIVPSGSFEEDLRRFNHANLEALHRGLITREELIDAAVRWAEGNMLDAQYRRYQTALQQAQNITYLLTHTSDPKTDIPVPIADFDDFIHENHLDRDGLMRMLRGEVREYKGWSVSPGTFAGSGYAGVPYREVPEPEPDADETPQATKKRMKALAEKRKTEQQAAKPRVKKVFKPKKENNR
jgi:hypothetical protein